ncbi:MAG: hypothetical protein AMJ75_08800, partial [Phycisphaerae bacterium SM1_79]
MIRRTRTISALLAVLSIALPARLASADLIGHWKFDDGSGNTAADSSGYGNDGTVCGTPTWQPSEGYIDGALEFDGINDYVTTDFALDPSRGAFSAFAWIRGAVPGRTVISQAAGTGFGQKWLCTDPSDG